MLGRKGLGDPCALSEGTSDFLWDGDPARAQKLFQENKCEGEPFPFLLSSRCSSGRAPGAGQADRTADGHTDGGRTHRRPLAPAPQGGQRNFLVLEHILDTPVRETHFSCQLRELKGALLLLG